MHGTIAEILSGILQISRQNRDIRRKAGRMSHIGSGGGPILERVEFVLAGHGYSERAQHVLRLVPTLPSIWLKGVSRRTAMLPRPISEPTPEILIRFS